MLMGEKKRDKKADELNYTIIGSGSSGNCVVIENVMVDCGLPYSKIKESLYEVDYLLITHRHTDHIKDSTFKKIRAEFPNITVISNYDVAYLYDVDITCNAGYPVEVGGYSFMPFEGNHNVLCYGYTWVTNGKRVIYATDMTDFSGAPEQEYDVFFLECNHDEHKLKAVMNTGRRKFGYDVYAAGMRHCSTQRAYGFYYSYRSSKDAPMIELHKSERFY